MVHYRNYIGLGIAGNFALHLDQAGEAEDFKDIITEDEAAPKGIFPFYLPCQKSSKTDRPREILSTYPLSSSLIKLPTTTPLTLQAEPEVALLCEIIYDASKIVAIQPKAFTAYNDCSIRVGGAQKISDKKNWGACSKGIAPTVIAIDKFTNGGIMDNYSICSFLERKGELYAYGEDVSLNGYSYFYEKLSEWIVNQINTQEDFGPLEDIKAYIEACNRPKNLLISIGATRYTPFGETNYLKPNDKLYVVLYQHTKNSINDVVQYLREGVSNIEGMSILVQEVK
jgi:hypothetical protein